MKARWLVEITVTSFGIFAVAACAVGTKPFGSGNGGEGGDDNWTGGSKAASSSSSSGMGGAGGAGSSAGGAGGAGGASAASSASSASSAASSASSSGVCLETPCKLVSPQCGCPGGEMCTINGPERLCVPSGSAAIGNACMGNECAAGGLCVTTGGMKSTCKKFCSTDSHCTAPGGLCATTLNDGSSGQIPGVTLCSDNCDPTTTVGCPVAGMSCQIAKEPAGQMRYFTQCTGAGSGTQGASCTNTASCAPTFGCFNVGTQQCVKYCKIGGAVCPGGLSCTLVGKVGSTEYGVCL